MIVHCKTLKPGDEIRQLSGPVGRGRPWLRVAAVDIESPRGGRGKITLAPESVEAAGTSSFEFGGGHVWVAKRGE